MKILNFFFKNIQENRKDKDKPQKENDDCY